MLVCRGSKVSNRLLTLYCCTLRASPATPLSRTRSFLVFTQATVLGAESLRRGT